MEKRTNVIINKIQDCTVMTGRCVKHMLRHPDTLIMTMIVPVMILLVFTYLFGGAVNLNSDIKYINFVVPGVLILSVGYSASTTSVGINGDFKNGIVDRFRSMPIAKSSFLVGHITAALIRNFCTTAIVIGIAFIFGFRPTANFSQWIITILLLLLFAFMVTSLAALFGILASTPDGAGIFGFVMMFLPYLSSAFVPIESMPKFLQGFSTHQPISVVLETVKNLLFGTGGGSILVSVIWCVSIVTVSLIISVILFMRKTSR